MMRKEELELELEQEKEMTETDTQMRGPVKSLKDVIKDFLAYGNID
jgi:hypothetical protein